MVKSSVRNLKKMVEASKFVSQNEKDKRVKIQIEGEAEIGEGEMGRRKMKRFHLPELPRWWQPKVIQYAFAHPHVRARLEKHMGSNLVRLTDKTYMNELEERIRVVNEENLHKRISSRVLDEMERLKRLILVGKTPLKECPPELFHHPVFVFWRMVNREVARASKKRADAYYKKLKASQKIDQGIDEEVESVASADDGEQLTPEQLLAKCREELELMKQADIEHGIRFTDEQYSQLKYETNDVKTLKNLTTVEELYALADKIIGTKKQDIIKQAKEAQQHKDQQEAVQQDKEQQDTAQTEKDQQGKVQQD